MNDPPGKLALSLLVGLIVVLAIANIATRSHSSDSARSAQPSDVATTPEQAQSTVADPIPTPVPAPAPLASSAEVQGQDRYYLTRQFRDYARRQQITRPAYQHLPYRTSQIHIDITNVTSDGRIVLTVTPLGPNVNPRAEYKAFLARYHDPGSAYLAIFTRHGQ
jgi:hypothetical protein